MAQNRRRTEEFLSRGIYLPPSTTGQLSESSNKLLEEEASLNINNLIKQARIEKSLTQNMSSAALNYAKMIQPDFCNEKRGYQK